MQLRTALFVVLSMIALPVFAEETGTETSVDKSDKVMSSEPSTNVQAALKNKYEHETIYLRNHFFGGPVYVKDGKEKSSGMFYGDLAVFTKSDPESYAMVKSGKGYLAGGMWMMFGAIPATVLAVTAAPAAASFIMIGMIFGGGAMLVEGQNKIMQGVWTYNKNALFGGDALLKTAQE